MIGEIVLHEGLALAVVSVALTGCLGAAGWFCTCSFLRLVSIERRLTRLETKARMADTDFARRD